MDNIEQEVRNFKSPWFSRLMYKLWFSIMRYTTLLIFFVLIIEIFIYSSFETWSRESDMVWNILLGTLLFMFFRGFLMLIAYLLEQSKINRECKRLGITKQDWNNYKIVRK